MKKVYIVLLGLIFLSLLFFSLFGKELYNIGKPAVVTQRVFTSNAYPGFVMAPPEAVRNDDGGNYVYVLNTSQGYSRTIYTVTRVAVTIEGEYPYGDELIISSTVFRLDKVVVEWTGTLTDGCRVII